MVSSELVNIKKWCQCGTLVWDCPPGSEPHYRESVTCYNCGEGNPNHPWPWYQMWWLAVHYRMGKTRFRRLRRFQYAWERRLLVRLFHKLKIPTPRGWV